MAYRSSPLRYRSAPRLPSHCAHNADGCARSATRPVRLSPSVSLVHAHTHRPFISHGALASIEAHGPLGSAAQRSGVTQSRNAYATPPPGHGRGIDDAGGPTQAHGSARRRRHLPSMLTSALHATRALRRVPRRVLRRVLRRVPRHAPTACRAARSPPRCVLRRVPRAAACCPAHVEPVAGAVWKRAEGTTGSLAVSSTAAAARRRACVHPQRLQSPLSSVRASTRAGLVW